MNEWPITNFPINGTLQRSNTRNMLVTPMEYGPPKKRRLTTNDPYFVKFQQYIHRDVVGTITTFYQDTILNGTDYFYMQDPYTPATSMLPFRFIEPPTLKPYSTEKYIMTMHVFRDWLAPNYA